MGKHTFVIRKEEAKEQPEFWNLTLDPESSSISDEARYAYSKVLPYVKDFLCSPHPYRKGAVCPFVPAAIVKQQIFFTFFPYCDNNSNIVEEGKLYVSDCAEKYLSQKGKSSNGAVIILFPIGTPVEYILDLHLVSKESCIRRSLMLGALWKENQAKSLHNDGYYPLRVPIPILVIRDLTVHDLIFLDPQYYSEKKRILFLKKFIETFEPNARKSYVKDQLELATKIISQYKKNRFIGYLSAILASICMISGIVAWAWINIYFRMATDTG